MKTFNKISIFLLVIIFIFSSIGIAITSAATTPDLLTASPYGVLAGTFNANGAITIITGNAGYTTLGGSGTHTVTGLNIMPKAPQAGIDQGAALAALNLQACTFSFAPGAIDLATDTTHGQIGVYAPGVYCVTGATSVGTAGIILNGTGTYIFRSTGALNTVANSIISSSGASSCDVFWTPSSATTLGANSTFIGTIIDDAGITIGNTVSLLGRALAFATTVITDTDTINTTCSTGAVVVPPEEIEPQPATINVVKVVVNDSGGNKTVADFPLFVNGTLVVSGETNTFPTNVGIYTVTETNNTNYTKTFSGDCDVNGQLNLSAGQNKFCIITNDDIVVVPPPSRGSGHSYFQPVVPPLIDIVKTASPLSLPAGPGLVKYTYTLRNIGTVAVNNITMVGDTCSPIVLVSGDINNNKNLDLNEIWVHTCSTILTKTHTNIVTAAGWANGISATDIASATVVVGVAIVPPLIHVTKIPSPLALFSGPGFVTYTEKITNPGIAELTNVRINDDKCSPLVYVSGDLNSNSKLENTETWIFNCKTNLTKTTTNTVTVSGEASGLTARDFAIATVIVSTPQLPQTGLPSQEKNSIFPIIILSILSVFSIFLYFVQKNKTI